MSRQVDLPGDGQEIIAGDPYAITVQVWADAAKTTGVDISSRTYSAQVRKAADRTAGELEAFSVSGFTTTSPSSVPNTVVLSLTGVQTRAIYDAVVVGGYEIQYTDGGDPVTSSFGIFTTTGDYTR